MGCKQGEQLGLPEVTHFCQAPPLKVTNNNLILHLFNLHEDLRVKGYVLDSDLPISNLCAEPSLLAGGSYSLVYLISHYFQYGKLITFRLAQLRDPHVGLGLN